MNLKKHIPNAITCGNLLCGCLAIVFAIKGRLVWSGYLVGIAAILDFLDGFFARLLKVHSEIGKQLDSLADMVTFGVVPGMVMFELIHQSYANQLETMKNNPQSSMPILYIISVFVPFLIIIFSAIRLAKFNIDTRQSSSFIGVPTPANAMLICSLPLINQFQPLFFGFNLMQITGNIYFLILLSILMSYLLVAELPLFALKFKNFTWADNKIRFTFLISSTILLIVFQFVALPIIIFLYVILSIINNRKTNHEI